MEEICQPLVNVLGYSSGLPVNQLAGYAANLEFWIGEVHHRLGVLDGYPIRYRRMRHAQHSYESGHLAPNAGMFDIGNWNDGWNRDWKALSKTMLDSERDQLRTQLCNAARRFLNRCARERLIEPEECRKAFELLGLPNPGMD